MSKLKSSNPIIGDVYILFNCTDITILYYFVFFEQSFLHSIDETNVRIIIEIVNVTMNTMSHAL